MASDRLSEVCWKLTGDHISRAVRSSFSSEISLSSFNTLKLVRCEPELEVG